MAGNPEGAARSLGESAKLIDEHTIELTLAPGASVNDAFGKLSQAGISVANVRNPGSRLEEVFLHLISN